MTHTEKIKVIGKIQDLKNWKKQKSSIVSGDRRNQPIEMERKQKTRKLRKKSSESRRIETLKGGKKEKADIRICGWCEEEEEEEMKYL